MKTLDAIPLSNRRVDISVSNGERSAYAWLVALFFATVLEGALRKWLVPAPLHPLVITLKDTIAVVFIFVNPLPSRSCARFRKTRDLFLFVGLALFPAFVYGFSQDWQAALLTYKNTFLWGVLATHLAPRLKLPDLDRFIRVVAFTTIGMAVLGTIQYGSSAGAFVNRYAWSTLDASTQINGYASNGGVRATGTFSYITGFSTFSMFSFVLLTWRFSRGALGKDFGLIVAGLVGAVCCGLASGSRATSVVFVVVTAITALCSHNLKSNLRLMAALVMIGLFLGYFFDSRILASFEERWTASANDDNYDLGRAVGAGLRGNYTEILTAKPFGMGLGQQSGVASFRVQSAGGGLDGYDDAATKGIVEAGVLGLLAQLACQGGALVLCLTGLLSRVYEVRLCSASVGFLASYWLFSCAWHDHNASAMLGLLLVIWLHRRNFPSKTPSPANKSLRVAGYSLTAA